MDSMIGRVLGGRYEIEELIGSGGMARVYKAKCRQLNRYVAIKVLRDELKDDKEFVEKFKSEALAAASLIHPNVVSVFDSGEDEGTYYFVMEYVEGYTLKKYITSKGALSWEEACKIATGICSAIETAHKNNIVHRDIKPHNIMINSEGVVKVTDFGIARAVSSSTIVRGGSIIGSVHYFSPEQARGASSTFKSDIYSIGVVFYEMLTGRVPFDADNPFNVAKMQVEQMPIEPKRMNDNIPYSVNAVVMRALAKKPEERYNNASEMCEAIKNAVTTAKTYGDDIFSKISESDEDNQITTEIPIVIEQQENTEKKSGKQKKKRDRTSTALGVAIGGIIIVIALIVAVTQGLFTGGTSDRVEKFIGKNYEQVQEMYEKGDKYIFLIQEEENDTYDTGIIFDQQPKEGTKFSEEDMPIEIVLKVSAEKGEKMENYIGQDGFDVEYKLLGLGYDVEIKERNSSKYEKGLIIKTIPSEGGLLTKNEKVILYVSLGEEEIPDENEDENKPDEGNDNPSNQEDEGNNPPEPNSGNGNQGNTGTVDKPTPPPTDNPYEGL
ncbi:MAG: Stk1 family PASTA domain-containing Ser/Thr kinase [Clostridia bacterium]|nr:Stk1 family PASTA domain-containing Ser/Thr kinase [Clostridia bacterium]